MQEFLNTNHLIRARFRFAPDSFESRASRFQVSDTNRIFVRHPQRQIARRFVQKATVAIGVADGFQFVEKIGCVALILIIGQTLDPGA